MNKPLHIAVVANTAFNIYNFRLGLIRLLKEEGHHILAIAPADGYESLLIAEGVEFIPLKHLARKGTNPIVDISLINELRKIYREHQIDVALQFTIKPNIYGSIAARITNTKAICTVTGLGYTFLNKSIASSIAQLLYRFAFSYAHKVLFQNKDDMQVFIRRNLVDEHKTGLVPGSGIDINQFHPDYCVDRAGDNSTHFLMVARLLKDKGVYEYIAAAKNILHQRSGVVFHLLGDIDNDNPSAIKSYELQQWIKEGIIQYHPHTLDIRPLICQADCMVLPSYREGIPRVILEGMAMGKPSITTDVPGCRDAIRDGDQGFVCAPENAGELEKAIHRFLDADNKYINSLSINARRRAEDEFSTAAVAAIYSRLLKNL